MENYILEALKLMGETHYLIAKSGGKTFIVDLDSLVNYDESGCSGWNVTEFRGTNIETSEVETVKSFTDSSDTFEWKFRL